MWRVSIYIYLRLCLYTLARMQRRRNKQRLISNVKDSLFHSRLPHHSSLPPADILLHSLFPAYIYMHNLSIYTRTYVYTRRRRACRLRRVRGRIYEHFTRLSQNHRRYTHTHTHTHTDTRSHGFGSILIRR